MEIDDWLKRRGVRTHYLHDIVDLAERIDEARALQEARCMVVFLGDRGWGGTQCSWMPNSGESEVMSRQMRRELADVLVRKLVRAPGSMTGHGRKLGVAEARKPAAGLVL